MKNLIFFYFIIPCIAFSQLTKKDIKLASERFDAGLAFYENQQFDSCVAVWQGMVEAGMGKGTSLYGNAFFNVPVVYGVMGNRAQARAWYQKILASDLNDGDETGNLMEPHTNYKYKSAMSLATMAYQDSDYVAALNWLGQADTVYRYWGFEGSGTNISMREASRLQFKVLLLRKLNRKDEMVREIAIELLCAWSPTDFFAEAQDTLAALIAPRAAYKQAFDAGLEALTVTAVDSQHWVASFSVGGMAYRIPVSTHYPRTRTAALLADAVCARATHPRDADQHHPRPGILPVAGRVGEGE